MRLRYTARRTGRSQTPRRRHPWLCPCRRTCGACKQGTACGKCLKPLGQKVLGFRSSRERRAPARQCGAVATPSHHLFANHFTHFLRAVPCPQALLTPTASAFRLHPAEYRLPSPRVVCRSLGCAGKQWDGSKIWGRTEMHP